MRSTLGHFYPPTGAEFEHLWAGAAIVVDTNVLLDLYRYSEASRTEFAAVLQTVCDRLWIPHQVALEFHKNRLNVIDEQVSAFNSVIKNLSSAQAAFAKDMGQFRKNESVDVAKFLSHHQVMSDDLIAMVSAAKEAHPHVPHNMDEDTTAILVTALFDGRVGEPFEDGRMKKLYEDGAKRYQSQIPPGYRDSKKPEPQRYGDLVLWMQLMEHASSNQKDVLFITGDDKEDWWRQEHGKTIGPRPELVQEFKNQTGHQVHFYSLKQFLSRAQEEFNANISQSTYDEVESLSVQHESERLNWSLSAARVRSQIRETSVRLALLDSPRMGLLSSATRMAQIEEELRSLERSKSRLADSLNGADDPAEQDALTEKILGLQADIDRAIEAYIDEQETQASIADSPSERKRLNFQLLELKHEYETLAPYDIV
ncbi:hypothetical protein E3O62_11955 [Cryobacterium sp. TMT2-15-1]|uniref:PIN-like domain-containing protein n=1 Tax=Cryobacterium sp. TMT2-15-1 TaxID=1259246 RepID=UPI001069050F|nr:PIN-like domain-containing protein [Cryobacterium sp. TMT2-15-1]TFC56887.1 hypothetical protein E3O62_11955 [Cryobacterium sp. TMT2-15-1]